VDPSLNKKNQLNLKEEVKTTYMQLEPEEVDLQRMIQDVQANKEDIANKKQRLRDLEEEIVLINEKWLNYKDETNDIINQLKERIQEKQEDSKINDEPIYFGTEGLFGAKEDDISPDDRLLMLEYKIDPKFIES